MTDLETSQTRNPPVAPGKAGDEVVLPAIGWGLYLFGLPIFGVILAYIGRGNAPPAIRTNFTYMVRTFWIAALFYLLALVALILTLFAGGTVPEGFVIFALAMWTIVIVATLWFYIRCFKGLIVLFQARPIENPNTWFI